jgi:hypothetical protein
MQKIKELIEAAIQHECDVCGSDQGNINSSGEEAKQEIASLKVYLVFFCTGEYDDYHEYILKVFLNQEKAKQFADAENKWLNDRNLLYGNCSAAFELRHDQAVIDRFESGIDYTGANVKVVGPFDLE